MTYDSNSVAYYSLIHTLHMFSFIHLYNFRPENGDGNFDALL